MSMNTIFVPLCVGSLVTVTVSGCFFFQDEDCFGPDYCDGDKVWTFDGPEEWSSGCVENIEEDCSETGRVCQEYDDGYGQEAVVSIPTFNAKRARKRCVMESMSIGAIHISVPPLKGNRAQRPDGSVESIPIQPAKPRVLL